MYVHIRFVRVARQLYVGKQPIFDINIFVHELLPLNSLPCSYYSMETQTAFSMVRWTMACMHVINYKFFFHIRASHMISTTM